MKVSRSPLLQKKELQLDVDLLLLEACMLVKVEYSPFLCNMVKIKNPIYHYRTTVAIPNTESNIPQVFFSKLNLLLDPKQLTFIPVN